MPLDDGHEKEREVFRKLEIFCELAEEEYGSDLFNACFTAFFLNRWIKDHAPDSVIEELFKGVNHVSH